MRSRFSTVILVAALFGLCCGCLSGDNESSASGAGRGDAVRGDSGTAGFAASGGSKTGASVPQGCHTLTWSSLNRHKSQTYQHIEDPDPVWAGP